MSKLVPLILSFVLFGASPQKPECPSQAASERDRPHGANETIQIRGGTVKKLRGRVSYPTGDPVPQAVVEAYDYPDADKEVEPYRVVEMKKRRAACLTDDNGYFCFTDIPSGRYVLLAGTREADGMQAIYVTVSLDRRWWFRWWKAGREIKIRLQAGT